MNWNEQAGHAWVEAQGQRWPVGRMDATEGQAVHYGVRPTDITVSTSGEGIPAKVIVVEPTGAETELLLEVGTEQLVVVMHGRTAVQPDDIVRIDIAPGKAHVFDSAAGHRLQ